MADLGADGVARIRAGRVFVLGCGGLGSPVLTYLAAAGVGQLTLCDDDSVAASNLQRQVLHTVADLDRPKVDSAGERLAALNPDVTVRRVATRLTPENARRLVAGHDVVVDASDTFAARTALAEACHDLGLPEVYGAVLGWEGQVTVLEPGRRLVDVFGPFPGDAPRASDVGILATLPGVVGAVMATETLKLLTGAGDTLAGRLQIHDARAATWRTFTLPPLPKEKPHDRP